MIGACVAEPLRRPRGEWRDVAKGRDLLVEGRVVARVRPTPLGGWFWVGLGRNSLAGKGTTPLGSMEQACAEAGERARSCIEGLELGERGRGGARHAALVALDRAQPGLAGVGLGARVNLFCRQHLLGELPEDITEAELDAVREAVASYHRTGAWPEELRDESW